MHPNLRPLKEQLALSKDITNFEFLVKWKGYPLYDATWEPLTHLGGSPSALNDLIREKELPEAWFHEEESNDIEDE